MKLVVKNLGAIKKKSEVDLTKRFYTFVGYNNSGKTYISQVIWYLFSEFEKDFVSEFQMSKGIITQKDIDKNFENFEFDITTVWQQFQNIVKKQSLDLLGLTGSKSLIGIEKNLYQQDYSSVISLNFNRKLKDYYKLTKNTDSDKISISFIKSIVPFELEKLIEQGVNRATLTNVANSQELSLAALNSFLIESIFYIFLSKSNYHRNVFFLSSSRTFLPAYYKYLQEGYKKERNEVGEIIRNNPQDIDKIKFLTKKRHTSAVDSVLDKLNNLSSKSKIKQFYADLITDLEKLMQGSIGVENVEGIANSEFGFKVASDADKKTTLEMYQTSTSVNQLTLLYLYLKYWTEESNNFLIIDEPEENLHPENQIKLLDILVKFANRNNNRVLFTTHSPLMAEAVNNHAHITLLRERGEDVEKIIKDHNLTISPNNSTNDTLKHSDYATYFFNGEAIKEYPMTDFGVFFRDFKEAEDKVRTTANTLKEYIYNSQNKKENGEKLSE